MVPADYDVTNKSWYMDAAPTVNPNREAVWSDPYIDPALHGLIVTGSVPVFDALDQFRGAAAMDVQLAKIVDLVHRIQVGENGFGFLLDSKGSLIALPPAGYETFGVTAEMLESGELLERPILRDVPMNLFDPLVKMTSAQSDVRLFELGGTEYYIGYRYLPTVGYSLGIIVPSQELLTTSAVAQAQVGALVREGLLQSSLLVAAVLAISLLASTRSDA
jgi:hypothetical protein